MSKYKTAMGKTIDMAALAAKNEKVRAVGNVPVNARGDTIDSTGKVVVSSNKKASNIYQKTVSNVSPKQQTSRATRPSVPLVADKQELTAEERELEMMMEDDAEIEQIKAEESNEDKE